MALPGALEGPGPCEGFLSHPPRDRERRSRKYHIVLPEEGFLINNFTYSVNEEGFLINNFTYSVNGIT